MHAGVIDFVFPYYVEWLHMTAWLHLYFDPRIRTELYLEEQEEKERQREKVRKTVLIVYGKNCHLKYM